MRKIGWVLAAAIGFSAQSAAAITMKQLRDGIAADQSAVPGQQYIHFGPMKDGRELSVTTQMVNGSSAVSIAQVGPGTYVIRMGRTLALNALLLSDAAMICAHFPKEACGRMPDYIERVRQSPTPAQAPFVEDAFPDLADVAQKSRADEALYTASLLGSIQSLMVMITLHEIGHAALQHLDNPNVAPETKIGQEGEADGFASYVAETAGLPQMGMSVPFLLDATEETLTGNTPTMHPAALCRAVVMAGKSIDWLQQNATHLLAPSDDKARDQLAREMLDRMTSWSGLGELDKIQSLNCKQYVVSFATGFQKARAFVDQNTHIDSSVPGQK